MIVATFWAWIGRVTPFYRLGYQAGRNAALRRVVADQQAEAAEREFKDAGIAAMIAERNAAHAEQRAAIAAQLASAHGCHELRQLLVAGVDQAIADRNVDGLVWLSRTAQGERKLIEADRGPRLS